MPIALEPSQSYRYTIEPGELLPQFVRRYDDSLGATTKQQFIRAELHRREMEQQETQLFRNEIVMDRYREEDRSLGRGILWGMLFAGILIGGIALLLTWLGVPVPW